MIMIMIMIIIIIIITIIIIININLYLKRHNKLCTRIKRLKRHLSNYFIIPI